MKNFKKYISYKNKYTNLKNQIGGLNCLNIGFVQHEGECWHDSLMTALLLSNEFGDNIQKILLHVDIDTILSRPKTYKFLLPININYDDKSFHKFQEYSKIYLENIKNRLESKLRQSPTADPIIYKPSSLKRQNSSNTSIYSSNTLLEIYNINNNSKQKHGGNLLTDIITVQFYNYFFQTENKFINLEQIYNFNNNLEIDCSILEKTNCILITITSPMSNNKSEGHSVCFFKCNYNSENNYYYYDDNGIGDITDNKTNYKVFHKYNWNEKLISKDISFYKLLEDIKDMSIYLNNEKYKTWEIYNISLLYYDNFKNESEYYNKLIPSIYMCFSNSLLLSNRLREIDESLKSEIFPKIKSLFKMYTKLNSEIKINNFKINYYIHLNKDIRDKDDKMYYLIDQNYNFIYYLSDKLKSDLLFCKKIIKLFIKKKMTYESVIKIYTSFELNLFYDTISNDKDIMFELIKHNRKYATFLNERLNSDIDFAKKLLQLDIYLISNLSYTMKDNLDIILSLVNKDGVLIRYASNRLQNSRIISLIAINNNIHASEFLTHEIIIDADFYMELLMNEKYTKFQRNLKLGESLEIKLFISYINRIKDKIEYDILSINKISTLKLLEIIKDQVIPVIINYGDKSDEQSAQNFLDNYSRLKQMLEN